MQPLYTCSIRVTVDCKLFVTQIQISKAIYKLKFQALHRDHLALDLWTQGGVTPIYTVLRSVTGVKVSQNRFSSLTIDFDRKLVLTVDLFAFIFVHYLPTALGNSLTIVLCPKSALSIDLSL